MTTITIPQSLIKEKELVIIPQRKYEEFLHMQKRMKNILAEEADTDLAISAYHKEKRQGKLKTIKSLADLD